MTQDNFRVLLAEDSPADARLLREALFEGTGRFSLVHVETLEEAIARLEVEPFDVLLLDLSLPDAHGLETAERARAAAPGLAIVILTGLDDHNVAASALRAGAQDYLVKDQISPHLVQRAIVLAIQRMAIEEERRRIERLKDDFVALVSHELRTPLTSIRGALGLLAEAAAPGLGERGLALLEMASRNADRLLRLINDVLDLERLGSGTHLHKPHRVHVGTVMAEAVDLMVPQAERAGVSLRLIPLDAFVMAEPDRIIQTFINLIGNAVKFSESGQSISVSAVLAGDLAVFSVADQGRGIPPDMLESVFERFRQVDGGDSREKGGTGLGLAICREIVSLHGGRIWAESVVGRGTTIHFTLPVAPAPAQEDEAPAGPSNGRTEAARTRPLRRILVVDDNEDVLELARLSLELAPTWEVVTARSGADGLQKAVEAQPDAILMDVMMPDMDGPSALARLRALPETQDIPVIFLTAKIAPSERDRFAHLGVAETLAKPFDPLKLWVDISRVLGWGV